MQFNFVVGEISAGHMWLPHGFWGHEHYRQPPKCQLFIVKISIAKLPWIVNSAIRHVWTNPNCNPHDVLAARYPHVAQRLGGEMSIFGTHNFPGLYSFYNGFSNEFTMLRFIFLGYVSITHWHHIYITMYAYIYIYIQVHIHIPKWVWAKLAN